LTISYIYAIINKESNARSLLVSVPFLEENMKFFFQYLAALVVACPLAFGLSFFVCEQVKGCFVGSVYRCNIRYSDQKQVITVNGEEEPKPPKVYVPEVPYMILRTPDLEPQPRIFII